MKSLKQSKNPLNQVKSQYFDSLVGVVVVEVLVEVVDVVARLQKISKLLKNL